MHSNQKIWQILKQKLPFEATPEAKQKRDKIWQSFDVNNNGYLSLAQIDKAIRDVLQLPQLFKLKPVLIRAFQSAKNKLKSKNPHGDDYVSKAQFRFVLMYLRQYYQYWVAFDEIDKNDDRKITLSQFKQAKSVMERWGIKGDSQTLFKQADKDGHGEILFIQFVDWSIRKNLDLDTDDDLL